MRAAAVCVCLLALAAAPVAAQQPGDRVNGLIGTWSCGSAYQSAGTWTFTRHDDGTIVTVNHYTTASGVHGEFNEIYSLNAATGRWSWLGRDRQHPQVREEGSAAEGWTGESWTIEGDTRLLPPQSNDDSIYRMHANKTPLRIVYKRINDDAFSRTIEYQSSAGDWTPTSASTCQRVPA